MNVPEQDEDDEDGLGTIVVGLMQKNRRRLRHKGQDNYAIGYSVYQVMRHSKAGHTVSCDIIRISVRV